MPRAQNGLALILSVAVAACVSAPDPAEPLGPESVPLEAARSENPAPIAAPAAAPEPDACPLAIDDVIVEAEGVPNGMAIVLRKPGDATRVRELTRRWLEQLRQRTAEVASEREREGERERVRELVRVELTHSDVPDGAMVMFVPEDLAWDRQRGLENLATVRESVQRAASEMRESGRCPSTPPDGLELAR